MLPQMTPHWWALYMQSISYDCTTQIIINIVCFTACLQMDLWFLRLPGHEITVQLMFWPLIQVGQTKSMTTSLVFFLNIGEGEKDELWANALQWIAQKQKLKWKLKVTYFDQKKFKSTGDRIHPCFVTKKKALLIQFRGILT